MSARVYIHNGETDTLSGWAFRAGIKRATLEARMSRKGMSLAQAIETPVMKTRGKHTAKPSLTPTPKPVKPKLIRGPKHWYDYD